MNRWVGKIALVTGASSGIGLSTAKALFREGMIVVAVARRKEKIESEMKNIKGKGKLYALKCDVSKEEDVLQLFEWIKKNLGTVHVVVNNAGTAQDGKIIETTKEDWEKIIGVNMMGVLHCSKQAVIMMKSSGEEGHIINLNSIAGHRLVRAEGLFTNVYTPTKYAVTAITSTLELELVGTKIRTTSISPGYVKTSFANDETSAGIKSVVTKMPYLKAEDVADSIIYVLGTPPHVQVSELTIRALGDTL